MQKKIKNIKIVKESKNMRSLLNAAIQNTILVSIVLICICSICSAKEGIKFGAEGDFENAVSRFERECVDYPNDQFFKDALEVATAVINKKYDPEAASKFFEGAVLFRNKKDYREASKLIVNAVEKDAGSGVVYYYLGICYYKLNLYDKALDSLNNAVRINPGSGRFYYYLGIVNHFLNNIDTTIMNYNRAEELKYDIYYLYMNRGKIYEQRGDRSRAFEDYLKAYKVLVNDSRKLEKEITDFRLKIKKAREEGDWIVVKTTWIDKREADQEKRAFILNQNNAEICHMLGEIYYREKGQPDVAVMMLKKAIEIDRELMKEYAKDPKNYPYRKIEKLEVMFNIGVDILIEYYGRKGDATLKQVYENMKNVLNGKIEATKVK